MTPSRHSAEPRPLAEALVVVRLLQKLRSGRDVRQAKARRIREAIHEGFYEDDIKLRVTAARLVEDVTPNERG